MTAPSSSRLQILERVRNATLDRAALSGSELAASYSQLHRTYVRKGRLNSADCVALMIERLSEYDAEVVECAPEHVVACIADRLHFSRNHRFVAPPGLPAEWLAAGFEWKIDYGLDYPEIEHCEGVMTAAFAGVADSGTIVLHHSASEGRRVMSLLPDWHLCVLRASQVVETLPEYFDRCSVAPALATYISGPSATADIEMTRIKGVHGPRFLHVILVRDEENSATGDDKAGTDEAL
jgi:L-lactate dehydrogenase complex protein LldG